MSSGVITSKHPKMTNELYMEVLDIFKTLSEDYHYEHFPADKLSVALKALGFDVMNDATMVRAVQTETVDMKEFCKIVADHLDNSAWCAAESKLYIHYWKYFDNTICIFFFMFILYWK